MGIFEYMNEKVKKMTIFDVKLAQASSMCAILVIAKLIPQIMEINIGWLLVFLIICALRPLYVFFIKK